jgi:hypothetical protein
VYNGIVNSILPVACRYTAKLTRPTIQIPYEDKFFKYSASSQNKIVFKYSFSFIKDITLNSTICYRYNMLQVQYVTDTICYRYNMLQVQYVTDTILPDDDRGEVFENFH